MTRRSRPRAVLALLMASLLSIGSSIGCGGEPPPPAGACATEADCRAGQICVDGECRSRPDGGAASMDSGSTPPPRTDAGRDAGPSCPSMVVCGTPPACCAEGQECIEGQCLQACEGGVRCGADRATCCAAGQVCVSDACTDPGDPCSDSFECPLGSFCEPTLERCLPQFDPVSCETTPVFGDFAAEVEWSATTATVAPDCMHVITAPLVVDLDADGTPEVVVNAACRETWLTAVLRAYRGSDGSPLWVAGEPGPRINGRAGIAAGDLDGDGRPEIVALAAPTDATNLAPVIAFDDDGTELWRSVASDGTTELKIRFDNGAPTIADLDQDGTPEVILGGVVLEATGQLRWPATPWPDGFRPYREGTNDAYYGGISVVADIDLDGEPEVVSGRRAFEANGDEAWVAHSPTGTELTDDGYPAVAQFDDDEQPEVVLVAHGNVYLIDGRFGTIQWGPTPIPGAGRGGPPTVADFDGDGQPEIGIAGRYSYSVYDPTGAEAVLWSRDTHDVSSNATGSSVFDFEGDGVAEVIYGDECYMRVYRGSDGEVLLQIPSSSATIHEYPVVADVDADGNSEIVIVANDRSPALVQTCMEVHPGWDGARQGVFVYGDTRDQWVRTRRVWNQHAYHVTNVAPSGVIPAVETANWTVPGLNNYRQNVQGAGVFNAPDLAVLAVEVLLDRCPTSATLRARVTNEGSLGAPAGVPVSFYYGSPDARGAHIATVSTDAPLLPGAVTTVEVAEVELMGEPPYAFTAVVDDDGSDGGAITECDEDDNGGGIGGLDCDILF